MSLTFLFKGKCMSFLLILNAYHEKSVFSLYKNPDGRQIVFYKPQLLLKMRERLVWLH